MRRRCLCPTGNRHTKSRGEEEKGGGVKVGKAGGGEDEAEELEEQRELEENVWNSKHRMRQANRYN